jgi:cytochrome oxidase Cu insertion factor (SCO1/SenC/PrrC family)
MRFRILFFRLLFPVLFLIGCAVALHMSDTKPPPPPPMEWDTTAAQELVKDMSNSQGVPLPAPILADAKRIVLYFYVREDAPCQEFTARLMDFYEKNGGGREFQVLSIAKDPTRVLGKRNYGAEADTEAGDAEKAEALPDEDMPWWIVNETTYTARKISDAYTSNTVPYLFLLDGDGRILADTRHGGLEAVLSAMKTNGGTADSQ